MQTQKRVPISAFIDSDDHEQLVQRARSEERSVSAELRVAIREHLREQAEPEAAPSDSEEQS